MQCVVNDFSHRVLVADVTAGSFTGPLARPRVNTPMRRTHIPLGQQAPLQHDSTVVQVRTGVAEVRLEMKNPELKSATEWVFCSLSSTYEAGTAVALQRLRAGVCQFGEQQRSRRDST